jgi:phosphoglycolate phosphatase-like HAD superfamily hydrolase
VSHTARAVFFDFDGVIADSVDVKTSAFAALYADYGPETMAKVETYHLANLGMTRFQKFAYFQREFVAGPTDERTLANLATRFGLEVKHRVIASPEIPGARRALEVLSERLPLFVVSATPDDELMEILVARGIAQFFTSSHGARRGKPDTVADLLASHRLDPGSCIMVGDAMTDYQAATKNGLRFVGIISPGRPNPFPAGTATIPDLVGFADDCLAEWAA